MTHLTLLLAASLITSLVCAVLLRQRMERGGRMAKVAKAAPAAQRSALWRNAMSASLLLSLASVVAVLAPTAISAADRLTERLCLAAGLGFLVRLAVLLRRLGGAGMPGAASARRLILTGPVGPLAAAWAVLRSPLDHADPLPAGIPAAAQVLGAASASLRCDAESPSASVPHALLAPLPALLLCALVPPVRVAGSLGWAVLGRLPEGATLALEALALEMLTIVVLAAVHSARRKS